MPKPIPRKLDSELSVCVEHPERVLFLDIETTGLSLYYDEITIVGWSYAGRAKTFIKGNDVTELLSDADKSLAMVTFNGIRFDRRFLEQEFSAISLPDIHIDLMYLCRRVGLTGGQKSIEQQLDINFREGISDVDGFAAVLLWHSYLRGDTEALRTLIKYNRADIAAMGSLFDIALERLGYVPDLFGRELSFASWAATADRLILPSKLPKASLDLNRAPTFRELFDGKEASKSKIVGIDLTGSEARPTGWCFLDGSHVVTSTIRSDSEIIQTTLGCQPDLISIDSPLCLPFGRQTAFDDDPTRDKFGIMRQCERELKRRGINVYPSLLPSMQKLTARGIELAAEFRKLGIPVIESYPGAAQDIMRIPRKGAGEEWLRLGLSEFGISGCYETTKVTHDELDAITSAIVGTFHLANLSEELGSANEAPLVIPKLSKTQKPFVVGLSGPIAAGKTTVARVLEEKGFAYTRFSQVIDDILAERGLARTRENRQAVGTDINEGGRQRELAARTIERVGSASKIVVDGLRFPEDHAFLSELYGYNFKYIFLDADIADRTERFASREYLALHEAGSRMAKALESPVEAMIPKMKHLANSVYINGFPLYELENDLKLSFDWL
jgi:predicted nuclease with RNAse H fold/dephospho-CoA kinase